MENNKVEGLRIQRILFLAFFAMLFVFVGMLFKPFFSILLWSSLLYGLTHPLYRWATIGKNGKERSRLVRSGIAIAFTLGCLILIIVPLTLFGMTLIGQVRDLFGVAMSLVERSGEFFKSQGFIDIASKVAELSGGAIDFRAIDINAKVSEFIASYSNQIIGFSAELLKNLAGFIMTVAFFIFVLFFLYLDGRELLLLFIDAIPLRNAYTVSFLRKFRDTSKDLVIGYVGVAIFQGVMAFIVFNIMNVPAPLPLALLCGLASFIPLIGSGLVWVPVVLMRLTTGPWGEALLLFVLCAFFISTMDNFIRPFLLHARINLHPLLIFISIIGGLQLLGFNGLLLGPILLVMFFSCVDIFGKAYGRTRRRAEDIDSKQDGDGGNDRKSEFPAEEE